MLTIIGARPQFVKAAVISREISQLRKSGIEITEVILHTGQHFDENMSDIFFSEMEIPMPNYRFNFGGLPHAAMTGRMMEEIEKIILKEKPDWVLVYGDTNSTLAGALASVKLHIPIAHVEAGLRSWNKEMPEEVNRITTDHISSILFAPTHQSVINLLREGISEEKISRTGDVMYDAALFYKEMIESSSYRFQNYLNKKFVLVTVHRAENTDRLSRMSALVKSLIKVSESLPVVFPLHPRTEKALKGFGLYDVLNDVVELVPPLGYLDMVALEISSTIIVTDSGGVQKEAYFFQKPCITLRKETEWVELVDAGVNQLIDPENESLITAAILGALVAKVNFPVGLYGDGRAAKHIVSTMLSFSNELKH
jgi:UDP-GlcNAc3NAcA epimerase